MNLEALVHCPTATEHHGRGITYSTEFTLVPVVVIVVNSILIIKQLVGTLFVRTCAFTHATPIVRQGVTEVVLIIKVNMITTPVHFGQKIVWKQMHLVIEAVEVKLVVKVVQLTVLEYVPEAVTALVQQRAFSQSVLTLALIPVTVVVIPTVVPAVHLFAVQVVAVTVTVTVPELVPVLVLKLVPVVAAVVAAVPNLNLERR